MASAPTDVRTRSDAPSATPCRIACICGQSCEWERSPEFQIQRCPRCGRSILIYPLSPLLSLPEFISTAKITEKTKATSRIGALVVAVNRSRRRFWVMPTVAGIATSTILGSLLFYFLRSHEPSQTERTVQSEKPIFEKHLEQGREAVRKRALGLAVGEFQQAQRLLSEFPGLLNEESAQLFQRQAREAALFADLLEISLTDLLRGAGQSDAEWQDRFARHAKGRSVVIDSLVRRNAAGDIELPDFALAVPTGSGDFPIPPNERIRIEIDWKALKLLQRIPLQGEERVIFGARLLEARKRGPTWQVRWDPESGVLITDRSLYLFITDLQEHDGLDEVFQRQCAWQQRLEASP